MIKCEKGNGYIKGNFCECIAEWGILAKVLMETMISRGECIGAAELTLLNMLGDSMELLEKEMKEKESGNV